MLKYIIAAVLGLSLACSTGGLALAMTDTAENSGEAIYQERLLSAAASTETTENLNDTSRFEVIAVDDETPVVVEESLEVINTAAPGAVETPTAPPAESFIEKNWLWLLAALICAALLFWGFRQRYASTKSYFLEFPELNQRVALKPGTHLLGSSPHSDITVDTPDLDNIHAEFCVGAECTIKERLADEGVKDMLSSEGILLNGKRVQGTTRLSPGDVLQIGTTRAIVRAGKKAA